MSVKRSSTGTGRNNLLPGLVNPDSFIMMVVTAADTEESITIPAGARECVFSCETTFYADISDITQTVNPIVQSEDGTSPHLNPTGFNSLTAGDKLYFKSAAIAYIGIQFYGE